MNLTKKMIATVLTLVLLASLAMIFPTPALGYETVNDRASSSVASQTSDTVEQPIEPGATPEPLDCNKPLPGRRTTLGVDDEILIAFAGQSFVTEIAKYDNTSNTDAKLKHFWNWQSDDDDEYDLYEPRSVAITTADLDGDGKAEVVSAIGNNNPGRLEVLSIKNPEASGKDLAYDLHYSTSDYREGDNMGYLMATAAGDLDAMHGGDEAEEVVVAFQDDQNHLQLVLLDGKSDGGFASPFMGYWRSSAHARYKMNDIDVAVGDLDGDGYDDEIVVALSDGYEVLQVIVLEYNGSGLSELAYGRYGGASQVDVTTGVFSGDGKDQIAIALADGDGYLNVKIFEYDASGGSVKSLISWRNGNNYRDDIDYVNIASGDIDGDRWDEIVTAFQDRNESFQAVTLDADTGHLKFRGSHTASSGEVDAKSISVDAGDIDGDGKAEIVASWSDYDGYLQVRSFDDNSHCPCKDNGDGLHLRDYVQVPSARFTYLAMGDVDGNNLYGDYTGVCDQTNETRLISMVNRPPYWTDYNPHTDVAYASSIKGGNTDEDYITNSYGSSVTFGESFDFGGFKLGASFTTGWNHSITHSSTHGSSLETRAGWTSPYDGLVTLNTVTYYSYQYRKRDGSGLASVSVPVAKQTDSKKMTYWNQSDGAEALFPNSWVPAYRTAWLDKQSGVEIDDSVRWTGSDFGEIEGKVERVSAWIEDSYVNYMPDSWGALFGGPGVGADAVGLGIALTELNGNSTPELVVAWVVNPTGENSAYYSVGWDIPADPTSWSEKKQIPGWVGASTQGAALDIHDLNNDGKPEMLFGWIDNPGGPNHAYYRVGWGLDANGDISTWWPKSKPIEGALGSTNTGLGLTIADADGNGTLDLVAAWTREDESGKKWSLGYSIGRNLQESGLVDSWAPGHPIPDGPDSEIVGGTVAAADLVAADGRPELVVGWIENKFAYTRIGAIQQLGVQADQRPTDIDDPVAKDGQFKIKLHDKWWVTNGDLSWRWDKSGHDPIYISLGGGDPYWKVEKDTFTQQTVATSESYNYSVGGETDFLGIAPSGSKTWGWEKGNSYTISWEKGFFMDGVNDGLDVNHQPPPTQAQEYKYNPFTYMQEVESKNGMKQAYMVLDYFVPWRGSDTVSGADEHVDETVAASAANASAPAVAPGRPVIDSSTHPDPNTWYAADSATFNWGQPGGDPATVDSYRWYLDRTAETIPDGPGFGLAQTTTYETLSDGQWWLHVRAREQGGEWSETAHRAVRVDLRPPQVGITIQPPYPVKGDDWYNVPVTVEVSDDDGSGSGVQRVEVSTDGVSWQPYATPLVFDADLPLTTISARATDAMGHVSQPVSTTFGLDLSLPGSAEGPGCWEPGGECEADVITDTVGNQRLHLAGQLEGTLSGVIGLGIEINGERWTSASEVGENHWSFTSDTELGAGCHTFIIQSEDGAGNVESPHAFGNVVVWRPRERPDLSGSRLTVTPNQVRPGDTVRFSLSVPNSGRQESLVPISVTLPSGLHVLAETISQDGVYDPITGVISWPARYQWPSQERQLTFSAQVDESLPATSLSISLTALGKWPIATTCPAEEMPNFHDLESKVERTVNLTVDPALSPGVDVLAPASPLLRIEEGAVSNLRNVQLHIGASAGARWMYVREWVWSSESDGWVKTQESDWLPFAATHTWTLSQGDGVKYLGVWLADDAGNVSSLERNSLSFTNLLESNQALANGRRIQYRFPLYAKQLALFNLVAKEGNPELYVWQPFSGFRPHYAATGNNLVETVGFEVEKPGVYIVEVEAEGDSQYQLLLGGDIQPTATAATATAASAPEHPLTVSDPLSAGVAVAPLPPGPIHTYYLPSVSN